MLRYVKDGKVKTLDTMQILDILPFGSSVLLITLKDGDSIYADKIIVV